MLIGEGKALNGEAKPEAYKDARIYAAVPYRAFRDGRLTKTDWRVLVAVCGYLRKGSQLARPLQEQIADGMGVSHVFVYRYVARLEAFGYLIRLAPRVQGALSTLYGIVFDLNNKPGKVDIDQDTEQLIKKEAVVQSVDIDQLVRAPAVKWTLLVVAWRKLGGGEYIANELEVRHWQELSILGCTAEHLAAWYAPGKPSLIGYYMQQARRELATV